MVVTKRHYKETISIHQYRALLFAYQTLEFQNQSDVPEVSVRVCLRWLRILLDLHGVNSFVTVHSDNVLAADADGLNEFR